MKILKDIKEYAGLMLEKYKQQGMSGIRVAMVEVGPETPFYQEVRKNLLEIGVDVQAYYFNPIISTEDLMLEVIDLQPHYDGLMLQMPLPKHINLGSLLSVMKPDKDVCGRRLHSGFKPIMAVGIMDYLKYCDVRLAGKDVVILGRNEKALVDMLLEANATVTICHEHSRHSAHIYHCDLIINAMKFFDCKPIEVPIIDMVNGAVNWENKDMIRSIEVFELLGLVNHLNKLGNPNL